MFDKIPLRAVALVCTLLGLIGALALIAGNYFIMYAPFDGSEYSLKKLAEIKTPSDLYIGMAIATTVGPLSFAGLYAIYLGLAPGGRIFSIPPVLLYSYALILVIAAEVASGLNILAYQLTDSKLPSGFAKIYVLLVSNSFWVSFVATLYLFISLKWKKTRYPGWIMWANPFLFLLVITAVLAAKPPEWTGWLYPNRSIIPLVIFLLASFVVFSGNRWLQKETPAPTQPKETS